MSEAQEAPQVRIEVSRELSPVPEPMSSGMRELQDFLSGKGVASNSSASIHLADPHAVLPFDSDLLRGSHNAIQTILSEVNLLIEAELSEVVHPQKQIAIWEERIRQNNGVIVENIDQIKQNVSDMLCDNKSRDFWWDRSKQVLADYGQAETAGTVSQWGWLIKKYGLKNEEGYGIEPRSASVQELCQVAVTSLANEYQEAGVRFDHTHRHKELGNALLLSDNGKLTAMNEQLQKYIAIRYSSEIGPLQDGVLLLKEFALKLKSLERQEPSAAYGDLRSWAEEFLDQFLKANPSIPNRVVTAFRRLASIPLPAQNS